MTSLVTPSSDAVTEQDRAPASQADARSARFVARAAQWIDEGRRLDMQGLADELGVSRVTLFRRVGSREALLSKALWNLTGRMLEMAAARWEAERPEGELHTPGTGRYINTLVSESAGLRRLLDDEPALTIRVLTDPRGLVQTGIVAFIEDLLRRDVAEFGLVTLIEPGALAYALVRLGESFLYADVLAARKPDVATANRLQQALIEGILPLYRQVRRSPPAWSSRLAPWPRARPRPGARRAAATGRAAAGC